jgi:hypothetical protein
MIQHHLLKGKCYFSHHKVYGNLLETTVRRLKTIKLEHPQVVIQNAINQTALEWRKVGSRHIYPSKLRS